MINIDKEEKPQPTMMLGLHILPRKIPWFAKVKFMKILMNTRNP